MFQKHADDELDGIFDPKEVEELEEIVVEDGELARGLRYT